MPQEVQAHQYANGLTLLVERMPHVRSAAYSFSTPAGCAYDPADRRGLAGILADMLSRGAGSRNNREFNDALDALGVDRSESAGVLQLYVGGSTLARNLKPALELSADMLLRARLPADELEPVRSLALQDLQSLEDEAQAKVMRELRARYYPDPYGRDHRGTEAGVRAIGRADVEAFYRRHVQPSGAILSIAGDVEFNALRDLVGRLLGDWKPQPVQEPALRNDPPRGTHLTQDLDQTQISVAYGSVPLDHPEYYAARGAVGVLSEGMSSRLFTEVREKYGLCYAIGARHEALRTRGSIIGFTAGTPDKAQELLERMLAEFRRLGDGIADDELQRVKASLKAALIMRQESTGARAAGNASDWFLLGRVRPLEEIQTHVDSLTPGAIMQHLQRFPARDFTVVTLGREPLKLPSF